MRPIYNREDTMLMATKRYAEQIIELQETVDRLTLELTEAKMTNERLREECAAWDQGRDEMVENHQAEIADHLEQLQIQLDKIKELEARVETLQAKVDYHAKNCLQQLKNYMSHNDDVTTTER